MSAGTYHLQTDGDEVDYEYTQPHREIESEIFFFFHLIDELIIHQRPSRERKRRWTCRHTTSPSPVENKKMNDQTLLTVTASFYKKKKKKVFSFSSCSANEKEL